MINYIKNFKFSLLVILVSIIIYNVNPFTFYQIKTAYRSLNELANIPKGDIKKCLESYEYLQNHSSKTWITNTDEETEHVRNYYLVVQAVLAIADIEKMYIPPQENIRDGVYENQIILEKYMVEVLNIDKNSYVLDMGCGRGRVAHHVARLSGGNVSGFNIDERQINHAIEYSIETEMDNQLDFRVGNFQKPFPYENLTFDASYDMQAIWGFTKKKDLDFASKEIYRTLKPGGRFFSNTYALTSAFDLNNEYHRKLHSLFLPTLAATQSNYADDIVESLRNVGFNIKWSRPSIAPAWPLTDQKTTLFHILRNFAKILHYFRLIPVQWIDLIDNLLKGGVAWQKAERAKIADLCWQIVAEKPK